MPIPRPQLSAQVLIADVIDHRVAAVGEQGRPAKRKLERHRAYRTPFFVNVVTDKFDGSDAAEGDRTRADGRDDDGFRRNR